MLQVIAFDCYGTLEDIHTDEGKRRVWITTANLMRYHGASWSPSELKRAYHAEIAAQEKQQHNRLNGEPAEVDLAEVFRALYAQKGAAADDATCAETMRVFRAASTDYYRLYPGTVDMLTALRKAGVRIALLSNAQRLFTEPELRSLGIWDCFDRIFISSDAGVKKPSPLFYQQLLDWAQVAPDQVMMVGNSPKDDILPAQKLGLQTAYIHSKLTGRNEPAVTDAAIMMDAPDMPELQRRLLQLIHK